MTQDDFYTFHINAYSPETIPLARLAEYMAALAEVYGEKQSVHFQGLSKGSTRIISRVQREAAPKVRENVVRARAPLSHSGPSPAFKRLDDMLRSDNADGSLYRGDATVLTFPGGRAVRPPKMGPFTQPIEMDGVLVRVGGKDQTAHAIIEDESGETWSFEVSREIARQLAHHLFEKPVRLIGTGRWFRDEEGRWQASALRASDFEVLGDSSLSEVVARLREVARDSTALGHDPIASLLDQRRSDKGPH